MKTSKTHRCASAGIGLIIILLLAAVIFAVKWWLKSNVKDPDIADLPPWKEWRLRESDQNPLTKPLQQHPRIKEPLFYDLPTQLPDNNSPRGTLGIIITLGPDGSVFGQWYGHYYKTSELYCDVLNADFSGNFCPLKIYRNEQGEEDPSKLYFLAKGTFLLQLSDLKTKLRHEGGDIYVKGWLDSEYNAVGQIFITTNEIYVETFTWQGKPTEQKATGNLLKLAD